jgi:murein DD-endopeptidase MepM/ murein hydrolase activator NlpD
VIDHGSGVTTWYGHNSKLSVRVGDVVKQGQTIALVGKTGLTTGPHLDFRIKIGDHTVDPLQWLP